MQVRTTPPGRGVRRHEFIFDLFIAALSVSLYLLLIDRFRFRGALADDDMYRMLRGVLDGAHTGSGLRSPLHYGKAFSFGYLYGLYAFVPPHVLLSSQRLIALINRIGFWSAAAGSVCFWGALRLLYGLRRATVAIALFLFSPILLEEGTSGHPGLISFAFFSLGALLLFLPLRGVRALLSQVFGSLLLLLALTLRADVMLAFPFVILAPADFRSFKLLKKSALLRAAGPALATAAFFLLKRIYADSAQASSVSLREFFATYYKLAHIPIGIAVCFLACGAFTVLLGMWAAIRILRGLSAAPKDSELRVQLLRALAGPVALSLPSLLFWIADPAPARHFFFFLAGASILAAWLITSSPLPRWIPTVRLLSLAIVLANQAFGALSGPIVLRYYPFKILSVPGQPRVMMHVPVGDFLSFHRAIQAELTSADAFAESLRGLCGASTVVITDHMPQVSSHIYGWPGHWTAEEGKLHGFSVLAARNGGRTILFLSEHEGWPRDPVAIVLAAPALQAYKLVRDPDTLSIYDKAAIPADRAARFGCSP